MPTRSDAVASQPLRSLQACRADGPSFRLDAHEHVYRDVIDSAAARAET